MDLLEFVALLIAFMKSTVGLMGLAGWALNAILDLFLHAMWSGVASLIGLWATYWAMQALYFVLDHKVDSERGLSFTLTRRVVSVCILAQFTVDILGHAYAVFRQDIPVTLENLTKYGARDFHAESWCLSLVICIVFGIYLAVRLVDALKHQGDHMPVRLGDAIRRFSYTVALFASISSHMWWDGRLSFG